MFLNSILFINSDTHREVLNESTEKNSTIKINDVQSIFKSNAKKGIWYRQKQNRATSSP